MNCSKKPKRKWKDLTKAEKTLILILASLQITLHIAARRDIARRSQEEICGNKRMWVGLSYFNIIGPLAYFIIGRRQSPNFLCCKK